ncbi:hypothetical protein EVAR_62056_1 [Eumeta japonica]|uniref:Uncharacterized protein n=1 Tax=Eumeta variegata TaxID=151549 RepID=A0A4C1YXT3_EUMVA|nr:hypothetical protein EVAR_62056_1 [Eumeta japonica]
MGDRMFCPGRPSIMSGDPRVRRFRRRMPRVVATLLSNELRLSPKRSELGSEPALTTAVRSRRGSAALVITMLLFRSEVTETVLLIILLPQHTGHFEHQGLESHDRNTTARFIADDSARVWVASVI